MYELRWIEIRGFLYNQIYPAIHFGNNFMTAYLTFNHFIAGISSVPAIQNDCTCSYRMYCIKLRII